jgi:hypothetical protein
MTTNGGGRQPRPEIGWTEVENCDKMRQASTMTFLNCSQELPFDRLYFQFMAAWARGVFFRKEEEHSRQIGVRAIFV